MALPPPSTNGKPISDYAVDEDALGLRDHLQRLLETVVAVYEQAGVPLPARRFYMVGAPAEDCEQVVVSLLQVYLGIPGDQASEAQNCNSPATAVVNIHVTRNWPIGDVGKAVTAERIMTASDWSLTDSWVLMKAMREFDKDEYGVPGPGVIATVTGRPPGGAVQTTVMNLSTTVL